MSDYSIEKLTPERFEVLVPLMQDCFGINVNIDYFKWKFLDNPSGEFVGFIAIHEETKEIAAYYGVIPEEYRIQGEKRLIFQSCDTMTHSNHRRKGLFQKLASHCYHYLEMNHALFVIGFGGEQSTPGFIKIGWQKLVDIKYLFIPRVLCFSAAFSQISNEIKEVEAADVYDLVAQKSARNKIQTFHTFEQFVWRLSNPLHPCKVIKYKTDGFIAYYISENKLFLLDFYFSGKMSRMQLMKFLKKEVLTLKISGIITIAQDKSEIMTELKKSGFINNPFSFGPLNQSIPFIFLADQQQMKALNNPLLWNISAFEHDSF